MFYVFCPSLIKTKTFPSELSLSDSTFDFFRLWPNLSHDFVFFIFFFSFLRVNSAIISSLIGVSVNTRLLPFFLLLTFFLGSALRYDRTSSGEITEVLERYLCPDNKIRFVIIGGVLCPGVAIGMPSFYWHLLSFSFSISGLSVTNEHKKSSSVNISEFRGHIPVAEKPFVILLIEKAFGYAFPNNAGYIINGYTSPYRLVSIHSLEATL